MEGFYLLLGHLVGDYIVQTDWMAANKSNPHPGPNPCPGNKPVMGEGNVCDWLAWMGRRAAYWRGHTACAIHCTLYTLSIMCFCPWLPLWGYSVCFFAHFAIDRWRLASWWMDNVSGQRAFNSKAHPCWPWGTIVVDNTFHLLTLALIVAIHKWF